MESNNIKEKLTKLLTNIFQFDVTDLDFGVYKILNYKKKEITNFIQKDLVEEITKQLDLISVEEQQKQQTELDNLKKQLVELGIEDYESNQKYQEKKNQLENIHTSKELEKEIYNHIFAFFSRYYDKGDFISKKRYGSNEKYSIPYNGEEVLLHWANNDQYYIKTTESFKKFSFTNLGLKVNFRVNDVEEEKGNIKSEENKYFVVASKKIFDWKDGELNIYFEFRTINDSEKKVYPKPNQDKINEGNIKLLTAKLSKENKTNELLREENGKTALSTNLYKYTRRNTSDYFIHKDLKGFLERELDFYIKNEVVDISDVARLDVEQFNLYILEIKVLKAISNKIIEFLAQIENFQKKIWEKKKFVLQTDYFITLDLIDEKYYQEILENKKQTKEWSELFAFDIKQAITILDKSKKPLKGDKKIHVLKQNPTLIMDTKFFDEEFKTKILEGFEDIDKNMTGILINSENYQALNLLSAKYKDKIKCCYIDPPFNAKSSEILYKNSFKHSSWLSLIENRLTVASSLLKKDGVLVIAIDENEQERLGLALTRLYPEHERTCVTVIHNPSGQQSDNFSFTHEYAYFIYSKGKRRIGFQDREDDVDIRNFRDVTGEDSLRKAAKNCFYPILVKDGKITGFGDVCDNSFHPKSMNVERKDGTVEIYPIDPQGIERKWRFARDTVEKIVGELDPNFINNRKVWDIKRTKSKFNFKTVWTGSKYSANNHGTQLLNNILGNPLFSYPKSIHTVYDSINASTQTNKEAIVMDFFAGSGTTGHAVLKLNKDDGGTRKFILVEMGQYFETVLVPRIKKIIFSDVWKDGKPLEGKGSRQQFVKYHSLEQYEDALENIEFSQKKLSEFSDYFVKYMLDFETRESKTFLNIGKMKNPFNYKINIVKDYQLKEVTVDLIETYNYLIGLDLTKFKTLQNPDDNDKKYIVIKGKRGDKSAVIIWRDITEFNPEKDRDYIQQNILKEKYDEIHLNGDNLIKDAILIEEQLKKIMGENKI